MIESRTCAKCGQTKNISDFYCQSKGDKKYYRSVCKFCDNRNRKNYSYGSLEDRRKWAANGSDERKRLSRKSNRACWIVIDSRKYDRKRGLDNDLQEERVSELILQPCVYCGEQGVKMTLDRINNSKGHTFDNVLPACYRCNIVRGSMPYQAWVYLAHAMRSARIEGLFGDWTGETSGNKGKHRSLLVGDPHQTQ